MSFSLLRFSVGPIQSYIEAARSVRDLWTGSYILSWLTAAAAARAITLGGEPLHGHLRSSPLVRMHLGEVDEVEPSHRLRSCLPNQFVARFASGAEDPRVEVRKAVLDEWKRITDAVHGEFGRHVKRCVGGEGVQWDKSWGRQLDHLWDIRVNWARECTDWEVRLQKLKLPSIPDSEQRRVERGTLELLLAAAGAEKWVRHIRPAAERDDTRPKCQLTGEDEQMVPLAVARRGEGAPVQDAMTVPKYWEQVSAEPIGEFPGAPRLRPPGERLGAPALVKRCAWGHYLARRVGLEATVMRNVDTATIAAADWLVRAQRSHPSPTGGSNLVDWCRNEHKDWSGNWLHRKPEAEDGPPRKVFEVVKDLKSKVEGPAPRVYYAILVMDGDRVGARLRKCTLQEQSDLAAKLNEFALSTVPGLGRDYIGREMAGVLNQPVYAGGDDVLALVPLFSPDAGPRGGSTVFDLAADIAGAFGNLGLPGGEPATMSAGIAIVHIREDLRDALRASRAAEKAAKKSGRNRLAVCVCRRSGEHTTSIADWDEARAVSRLARTYLDAGVSDRWTYQLRAEFDTLASVGADAVDAECARLIARGTGDATEETFESWRVLTKPAGELAPKAIAAQRNALTLFQSASFMARGRHEDR